MLASAMYWKTIHNGGLGLITLLYLGAHFVRFITSQVGNTFLPPTLMINLNQRPVENDLYVVCC